MNRLHFYKAYSRLGLMNIPNKGTERNFGVELGPDAIATPSFLSQFNPAPSVTSFTFPLPEDISNDRYTHVITERSKEFADCINDSITRYETQIVLGGDHSVVFGSLLALFTRFDPKTVGYIQFDSHGDINTFSSSPSGNFHGMFLRPFLGSFDNDDMNNLVTKKLPPANVLYIGNLDLDPEENDFIDAHSIPNITKTTIRENPAQTQQVLSAFIKRFPHIHISFDVDVFDHSLVSATGTPAPDGLSEDDVFPLLNQLRTHPNISVDLVEVNPQKDGAKETISIGQRVLSTVLLFTP